MNVYWCIFLGTLLGFTIIQIADYLEREKKAWKKTNDHNRIASQYKIIQQRLEVLNLKDSHLPKDLVKRQLYEYSLKSTSYDIDDLGHCVRHIYQVYRDSGLALSINLKLNITENSQQRWEPLTFLNINLLINQAVHNAIVHSQSAFVFTICTFSSELQEVVIHDNGVGFNTTRPSHGGLKNMYDIAQDLSAQLTISSTTGVGTRITLSF